MRDVVLPIALVFNVAIGQPFLDLLGRHAEFFVAHDASGTDVVLVGVALAVVVPTLLGLLVWAIARLNRTAGTVAVHAAVGVLLAVLALQIVKRFPGVKSLPGWAIVAVAVALSAAGTRLVLNVRARRLLVVGSIPVAAAVLGVFVLVSPVSKLALGGEPAAAATASVANPAPVVMVVLDEFPLSTLIDRTGEIDTALFPNFAHLSRSATWFRNATAVHVSTPTATPAVLDGLVPREGRLPIVRDHPNNLLALLGRTYQVTAVEPVTHLCPDAVCRRTCPPEGCAEQIGEAGSAGARWGLMVDDMRIVFLHELLPASLTGWLPRIDNAWEGFAGNESEPAAPEPQASASPQGGGQKSFKEVAKEELFKDRAAIFRRWIATIRPTERSGLFYLHSMLPHTPWDYSPTGGRFRPTQFLRGAGRILPADPVKSALYYQRHIIQAQFVDRLIGELIGHLEQQGMYDDALLVIVSDHGASFRADELRRVAGPENLGDIAPVPLFIKRPHERNGGVSDLPVMTIDVLPSILDVLGVSDPPHLDGVSVFSDRFPKRPTRLLQTEGRPPLKIASDGRERDESLRRKLSLFGRSGDSIQPYALGPDADLFGRTVAGLSARGSRAVELREPFLYRSVASGVAVSPMTGYVYPRSGVALTVAVAVNGTIWSVTQTMASSGGGLPFVALIPPEAFRSGRNDIRFFVVEHVSARRVLAAACRNCP